MAKDFYINLPSNSSISNFPDNHAGHFFTSLPKSINIDREFEIGLSEIIVSKSFNNINEKEIGFQLTQGSLSSSFIYLEPGFYKTSTQFVNSLNRLPRQLRDFKNAGVRFLFSHATQKVTLNILTFGLRIRMTKGLADILGLPESFIGPVNSIGKRTLDIHRDNSLLYVYCDLIEHRLVGDTLAPLLRVLPATNQTNDIIHYIFQKPHYIPLAKRNFNFIEILLTTDTGKQVQLPSGKTVVTLHLRPRRVHS